MNRWNNKSLFFSLPLSHSISLPPPFSFSLHAPHLCPPLSISPPLSSFLSLSKINTLALAGVAQWIECQPADQRVTDSISSLGYMPGLWARSPERGTWEATTCWCFFPSLPSLKISKIFKINTLKNIFLSYQISWELCRRFQLRRYSEDLWGPLSQADVYMA